MPAEQPPSDPPEDSPDRPSRGSGRRHPLAGGRRGRGSRRPDRPTKPTDNDERIGELRAAIEATDSEDAETVAGYIVWTAERVELLGAGQVHCFVHLADLMLVARADEVVLLFSGLRDLGDRPGLLVLADAAPDSAAGRAGEPYERLEFWRLADGRYVFCEPFEPGDWGWMRL